MILQRKDGENVLGFELEGHANGGGEEEEDEAERRERPSGEGGSRAAGKEKGGVCLAQLPKCPHPLYFLSQVQSYSIPLVYFITRTKPKSII